MQQFIQQLINGLSVGSIYALIAVGYTMVYGVLQLINFAHGDVFMVGAMVSMYAATGRVPAYLPPWLHILVLVSFAAAFLVKKFLGKSFQETFRYLMPLIAVYVISIPALLVASFLSKHLGLGNWSMALFVLIFTIAVCGSMGFLIERLAYRPLRDRPRINSLITAIGISLLLEYGGQNSAVFGPTPQAYPLSLIPHLAGAAVNYNGIIIQKVDVLVLTLTVVIMSTLSFIVLKTRMGLGLRAVSYRFDTAALMGVNINSIIGFTFVLGSCLAAVAGILWGVKYSSGEPLMGLMPGIKAFIAAVFGGIGNIAGAVVGAVVLGLIEIMVVGYLPGGSQYKDGAAFLILIAILLVKPSGLLGKNVVEKV